jgi:hypothetical protein
LISPITLSVFGNPFSIVVEHDNVYHDDYRGSRVYVQITYSSPCSKTGQVEEWKGRKWYLSEYMTDDEVIKTVWAAFEAAVKHEIMEGFKINGMVLFNPHVDYLELLKISDREVKRKNKKS